MTASTSGCSGDFWRHFPAKNSEFLHINLGGGQSSAKFRGAPQAIIFLKASLQFKGGTFYKDSAILGGGVVHSRHRHVIYRWKALATICGVHVQVFQCKLTSEYKRGKG